MTKSALLLVGGLLLVAASAGYAVPTEWSGNGHYYDVVWAGSPITWDAAEAAAEASSHLGVSGHLVTFGSASEADWVFDALVDNQEVWWYRRNTEWVGPWIGLLAPTGNHYSAPENDWQWVDGTALTPEDALWSYWWHDTALDNQPNDPYSRVGAMYWTLDGNPLNRWADLDVNLEQGCLVYSYVVEYGSDPSASATPELSTWVLLGCTGLLGVGLQRRRRRHAIKKH